MRLSRPALAFGASLLMHAAVVALLAGSAVVQGLARAPKLDVSLVAVDVKTPSELPLGAPPAAASAGAPRPKRKPRAQPVAVGGVDKRPVADAGAADGGASGAADGGVGGDGGAGRDAGAGGADAGRGGRRDLRPVGPEGSRLTALLRLDRLRGVPEAAETTAAVDALLRLLPDRRRLLDGTGLDLYRDFDAVLIATPNPRDDAVTFLAARHHVAEPALKAALERGALAAGRPLRWRDDVDRPVAMRAARAGRVERDDRLFVLPVPGLAIMAPPAYAALLVPARPDAGVSRAAPWQELAARIDGEERAMPENAILMVTAANLFRGRGPRVVPGTRGATDDPPPPPTGPGGLPLPKSATLTAHVAPAPLIELWAELPDAEAARAWEARWPALKQDLVANPLLLLSGFQGLVQGIELERDGASVVLRLRPSAAELRRLLFTVGNLAQAAMAP